MKLDRVTCEWTVTSAQLLSEKEGGVLWLPLFYTREGKEQWKLGLYPRGKDQTCADSVSFFLYLHSSEQLGIQAEFTISILKSNVRIFERNFEHKFKNLEGWGSSKLMKQSKLLGSNCSEITIIIQCIIGTVISQKQILLSDIHVTKLTENLHSLIEDPKFSDIMIIVRDHKFPAHKSNLSVRSPVFEAMFNHEEITKNRENEVKIEDLEPAVVKGMLEYIYTGAVTDFKALASGLLYAADKYELEELKAECLETVRRNLDVNNAAEILELANFYRASELKKSAMKFIKNHVQDMIQNGKYKEITDPVLLQDIIALITQEKSV